MRERQILLHLLMFKKLYQEHKELRYVYKCEDFSVYSDNRTDFMQLNYSKQHLGRLDSSALHLH